MSREITKLQFELRALRVACATHDALPEFNRRYGEQSFMRDVSAAVRAALAAGYSDQAAALIREARLSPPAGSAQLWSSTLAAGEQQLGVRGAAATAPPVSTHAPDASPIETRPRPTSTSSEVADVAQSDETQPRRRPPQIAGGAGPHQTDDPSAAKAVSPNRSAANPAPLTTVLLAQPVLWGGSLLAAWLLTKIHYDYSYYAGGLALSSAVLGRLENIGLQLAPLLIASALVTRSLDRWLTVAAAGLASGVVTYVFWFEGQGHAWVSSALIVVLLVAGWLFVRGRPSHCYWVLLPVALWAGLWFAPYQPGDWLRDLPVRQGWYTLFDFYAWGLVVFAVAGLIALLAAAIPVAGPVSALPGRITVAGLAAAAIIAGTIGQASLHTASYTSPAAGAQVAESTAPSQQATTLYTAQQDAQSLFSELQDGGVTGCDGSVISEPVSNYTISQVSEQSAGSFLVHADVQLSDGTDEVVVVEIDLLESGWCADPSTLTTSSINSQSSNAPAQAASAPDDVPSVPTSYEAVPTDAALPDPPADSEVVPYTDASSTPQTAEQLVEYQPTGLNSNEYAAVADIIAFMTRVNQQDFSAAWNDSTYSLNSPTPDQTFRNGYRTSRFYQVAFGQPEQLADDLIVVPARFASRQDPTAQGDPAGVTGCSYWPQYVFVVASAGGRWLVDTAGRDSDRPELNPLKRASQGSRYLNPTAQRESC